MLADILYWAPWLDAATFVSCLCLIVALPMWIMHRRRRGDPTSLGLRFLLSIPATWLCLLLHGDFIDAPYFRALDEAYFRIRGPSPYPDADTGEGLIEIGILVIRLAAAVISAAVIAVVYRLKDFAIRKTDGQGNLVA